MKWAGLTLAVIAILFAAGCTEGAPTTAPTGKSPTAMSPTHVAASTGCPVTTPMPHASPPAQLHATAPLPVPYLDGWYGNATLWVGLPPHGVLPARRDPSYPGKWGSKFPWWRVGPGTFTITAQRLDGPTGDFQATIGDYGWPGFNPSYLIWPSLGCWRVTGTVAGHSLTIIMRVQAVPL